MLSILKPRKGILYCGSRVSFQPNEARATNVDAEIIHEIESVCSSSNTFEYLKAYEK
jgi:hypothetical protein